MAACSRTATQGPWRSPRFRVSRGIPGGRPPGQQSPEPADSADEGSLRAPLPGTVVALNVAVGDQVEPGQELLVIEAMKMQHVVRADRAGRVESLPVQAGATVDVGAVLAVLTEVTS